MAECPLSPADILREMLTDATIANLYQMAGDASRKDQAIAQWSELHSSGSYRIDYD